MGFRFRKSYGKGPFRVNLSKSGLGYSFGGKGFRITKKAGGGTRTTASIPGTGISYVTDSSGKKNRATSGADPLELPVRAGTSPTVLYDTDPQLSGYCRYCYRQLPDSATVCPACGKVRPKVAAPVQKNPITPGPVILTVVLSLFAVFLLGRCTGQTPDPIPEETAAAVLEAVEIPVQTQPPATSAPVRNQMLVLDGAVGIDNIYGPKTESNQTLIINTESGIFHKPDCHAIVDMSAANRQESTRSVEELEASGYRPCGICKP